jgi:hypothetical protein
MLFMPGIEPRYSGQPTRSTEINSLSARTQSNIDWMISVLTVSRVFPQTV